MYTFSCDLHKSAVFNGTGFVSNVVQANALLRSFENINDSFWTYSHKS